jgi:hypothetical protein
MRVSASRVHIRPGPCFSSIAGRLAFLSCDLHRLLGCDTEAGNELDRVGFCCYVLGAKVSCWSVFGYWVQKELARSAFLALSLFFCVQVVLDGEVAVPCNPQPATAGLNPLLRFRLFGEAVG